MLGDTSVSQDVCLLVDAGLYDQLPPAVERLCDEFARFRAGLLTVTGSARGTAAQMAELYEQARRLQAAAPENTLTLLERLNAEQHAAAHLMNYDTLRNADSYAAALLLPVVIFWFRCRCRRFPPPCSAISVCGRCATSAAVRRPRQPHPCGAADLSGGQHLAAPHRR